MMADRVEMEENGKEHRRGRHCTIDGHPQVITINDELMRKIPMAEIARKYGVQYESLKRHRRNCLQKNLAEFKEKYIRDARDKFNSTIDYIDELLSYFIANKVQVLGGMTVTHVLNMLRLRSELLGEEKAPPRIEIRWGRGLEQPFAGEEPSITIQVPKQEAEKTEPRNGADEANNA